MIKANNNIYIAVANTIFVSFAIKRMGIIVAVNTPKTPIIILAISQTLNIIHISTIYRLREPWQLNKYITKTSSKYRLLRT